MHLLFHFDHFRPLRLQDRCKVRGSLFLQNFRRFGSVFDLSIPYPVVPPKLKKFIMA